MKRWYIIISSLTLFIIVVLLYQYIFYKGDDLFNSEVEFSDWFYQENNFSRSFSHLKEAAKEAETERQWLMLIKRGYNLTQETGQFSYYREITEQAFEKIPENELILINYLSVLSSSGELERGKALAERVSSPRFNGIKGEILLSLLLKREKEGSLTRFIEELDPQEYEEIARFARSDELLYNAALLWRLQENSRHAVALLRSIESEESLNQKGAGLIYFDSQEFEAAYQLFNMASLNPQNKLDESVIFQLMGDAKLMQREYSKAIPYYQTAIDTSPEENWQALQNLSFIYQNVGDEELGFQLFFERREQLRENVDALIYFAEHYREAHQEQVTKLMSEVMERGDSDPMVELYILSSFNENPDPVKYRGSLWRLFNRYPDHYKIARYLAWSLIGQYDFDGAYIAMDRWENANREEIEKQGKALKELSWLYTCKGIVVALQGRQDFILGETLDEESNPYIEAREYFQEALAIDHSWNNYYNLAVVEIVLGNYEEAVNLLDEGVMRSSSASAQVRNRIQSVLLTKKGTILKEMGNFREAYDSFEKASELDPTNLSSYLYYLEKPAGE